MRVTEVRVIAKALGIKAASLPKTDLIKAIQKTEGNFDCFATATTGECDQTQCCWRDDCFKAASQGASALS